GDSSFGSSWAPSPVTDPWAAVVMERPVKKMRHLKRLRLHLSVPFISGTYTNYTPSGLSGYWGSKGEVAICFWLYGYAICFFNCHLLAHVSSIDQRLGDFDKVLETQNFEKENIANILDHDLLLWFGDLNFCIEDYELLQHPLKKDHLNMMKKTDSLFQQFQEGPLPFQPTYIFDVNSENYDYSEKRRKPAWTDRILWRLKWELLNNPVDSGECDHFFSLTLKSYESHMKYKISDHMPVTVTFELELKSLLLIPPVTSIPEGQWITTYDLVVSYTRSPDFISSSWYWIGLHKVVILHVKDYVTYAWVKDNLVFSRDGLHQVYINASGFSEEGGEFLLSYCSNSLQAIVGQSEPLQISENAMTPEDWREKKGNPLMS
uniref:Inositol polyphosphate-related phosphatase domain-containing protein n=1 Tax=Vombatus ursinus TaxID=29139 RepID=A0A4X2LZH0_VOMUR